VRTEQDWEKWAAESRADHEYYDRLYYQAKLARSGLAPVPVVPRYFRGISAVVEGRRPYPSVTPIELGTLRAVRRRRGGEVRLKVRQNRSSRWR